MDRPDPPPAPVVDPPSVELPFADELPQPHHPTTPPPHHPATRPHASPFRILANIAVGFVSLFLLLRTIAVEPFGVPTGSMAPALIGNHREGPCPRCGYPVRVGMATGGVDPDDHFRDVMCPNCARQFSLADARDLNGDRLLVDKNVFDVRRPRRWEMAVFRCPDTDPKEAGKPYVKRIVGLPGETLVILDGELYADGELLRKGLAELRETRVPVFDMAYVPTPGGWNAHWLVEPPENDERLPPATARFPQPADASVVKGGVLTLDASETPQTAVGLTFRNWNLDHKEAKPVRVWSSYDGLNAVARERGRPAFDRLPAAHDFSFAGEVTVEKAAGSGEATFACRLFDGADSVRAEVSVGPRGTGRAVVTHDQGKTLGSAEGVTLEPGRTHRVEFSFVDRRAILAIDGRVVVPPADLPPAAKRGEVARPLQLGARGCRLLVREPKLYRDTYYTQYGEHGTQAPAVMGPNEYFALGDNSGNSQDGRKWPRPGVPEAAFIGKPFIIHQPLRPARVTVGGRERVFPTVDWARLRWLH